MIYAFVDSFISQFDFGVPSIYSRSECSTMPQARDQLFVLARGCQWHQTADTSSSLALNIWKPQKDNKVRGNLRGLLGSYFHHSDHTIP